MFSPQSLFCQVNLIFPTIYIICSILVTLVPMIASPKETGERVNITYNDVTSNTLHRHWMCHHCQWNTRLLHPCLGGSLPETGPNAAILGSELALYWQKPSVSLPSQHNNRVAEAVCGGDAGEKIGLKFNEDCTTLVLVHKVANHPHVSPFNRTHNFRQEFSFSGPA